MYMMMGQISSDHVKELSEDTSTAIGNGDGNHV